ncbi:unnamed protein product [Meloidogyne enterolobii]|uniref:Uncharacterized protein n=1 Tax=Meloidogyne enterolobii TaxID=390850 RepID=A0ACB0ZAG0_MELEN
MSSNYCYCYTFLLLQSYNHYIHKNMERETPIECSISSYSKSVQIALDNKELIEEATFIVFIYYFLRKRPSFQEYIK